MEKQGKSKSKYSMKYAARRDKAQEYEDGFATFLTTKDGGKTYESRREPKPSIMLK